MADNKPTEKPQHHSAPPDPFDLALTQVKALVEAYEAKQNEQPQIPADIPRFVTYSCRS